MSILMERDHLLVCLIFAKTKTGADVCSTLQATTVALLIVHELTVDHAVAILYLMCAAHVILRLL